MSILTRWCRLAAGVLAAAAMVIGLAPPPAGAVVAEPSWGRTFAPDQPLRGGCHAYNYRYRVMVPGDNWSAELFLRNRRGVGIASAAFDSGADPKRAWRSFKICRPSTVYGRHTIRIKVTTCSGFDCRAAWGRTSSFRLYRRR